MARFDELEQFLRKQETALVLEADTQRARYEASRDAHDPFIRSAFNILGEWYERIIAPRTDLLPVLKKRERPEGTGNDYLDRSLYRYRVNMVQGRPNPTYHGDFDAYHRGGEIGFRDWHPNVALQFDIVLEPHFDRDQRQYTDDLDIGIIILTWGPTDREKAKEIADSVNVNDHGWNSIGTTLWIIPAEKSLEQVNQQITDSLTLLTSNVLNHSEFWKH